jgi:hypothetical protein
VIFLGLSAWSVPRDCGRAVGDYMRPPQAAHSLGILPVFVDAGQAIGPAVAGVLANRSGSFDSSYLLETVLAVVGMLLSLTLRAQSGSQGAV